MRQIPNDFAETAQALDRVMEKLQSHYRASYLQVSAWMKQAGIDRRIHEHAIPDDLGEMAKTMTGASMARHYKVSEKTVARWLVVKGLKSAHRGKPVPADFMDVGPTLHKTAAARHYKVKIDIISRWYRETGITPAAFDQAGHNAKLSHERKGKPIFHHVIRGRSFNIHDMRRQTIYDEAADVLRHYAPCYRCGPTGRAMEKGLHWRFGNTVMTPDELLERAERYRNRAA